MLRKYKILSNNIFENGIYKLVPIRDKDKYFIMQWRNDQIDILRQKELLTKENQDAYFENVVDKLFEQKRPNQLLFSFLENNKLIGYGGLVHIDWVSSNAEISFITDTTRNENSKLFIIDFLVFLSLIKYISFDLLNFLKIYTTFYKIAERETYRSVIVNQNFTKEAELKKHIMIKRKWVDVFIYSFFNKGK